MDGSTDEGLRALVVDDDPAIRALLAKILEREDYRVDRAADGLQAIEKLQKTSYQLVLLDLMMPKVDGYEVLGFLRERRPEQYERVIVMTALAPQLIREPIPRLINKPFDVRELLSFAKSTSNPETIH